MKKDVALFVTIGFVLLCAGNYFLLYNEQAEREKVIVARAIDGDTVVLNDGRTIRLVNINTPERNERGYDEAKEFLQTLENKTVFLENRGVEKYGRGLGVLYVDNENINLELVRRGLAHTLLVEDDEAKIFHRVQEKAFETKRGIWERSPSYGCLQAEIDKKEEYILFRSQCGPSLHEWTVKDETTHSYKLGEGLNERFTLYSEEGVESSSERYWGRGNVWNNDRDSLFVRDENELLVLYSPYGY